MSIFRKASAQIFQVNEVLSRINPEPEIKTFVLLLLKLLICQLIIAQNLTRDELLGPWLSIIIFLLDSTHPRQNMLEM